MRGILFCWMQQIDKVNSFKQNNSPEFALHARFDLQTGMKCPTSFSHLQMDLVALYILTLVQMTAGGIQIIYTNHEVAFLQNLVFYIERTYRTPDFGMWERGNRYNVGVPELHASSLGLVKKAKLKGRISSNRIEYFFRHLTDAKNTVAPATAIYQANSAHSTR